MADETPLERLGRLAGDLAIEATRADVTGEDAVKVGHEWADEMVATSREVVAAGRKPTGKEAWRQMGVPAQMVVTSAAVALTALFLGAAWVVIAWAWDTVGSIAA